MLANSFVCKFCKKSLVNIFESRITLGFAHYMYLRCDHCLITTNYWSISGKFRSKVPVGKFAVSKRNDSLYQAVLGARLAGIGKMGRTIYLVFWG